MADQLISGNSTIENIHKYPIKAIGTSGWDFTLGDFTTDGGTYALDLSDIVPEGTDWVNVRILISDGSTNVSISIGSTNPLTENAITVTMQEANVDNEANGLIQLPADRKLYYTTHNTVFTKMRMKVIGYI